MVRRSVFYPISMICFVVIAAGFISPDKFYEVENAITQFAFGNFGFLFQLATVVFLGVCIFFALSKYGKIKLGGPKAEPEVSLWSWFTIALASGIGTGILFFGVAEPITHYMDPEFGIAPGSEEASMFALSTSFMHWTFIPYAMYGVMGIGTAYAAYNMKLPLRVSSTLYPVLGDRVYGPIGSVVDNICVFAIIGGAAGALGSGVLQMGQGITILTGYSNTTVIWVGLLAITVITYIVSSYTGLHRGIRVISDINTKIFFAILVFVFIFGPTAFILSLGTQSVGSFFNHFIERALYLSPIDGSEWPRWWPIFYWAIWLAYAPMIGMFLARISKGRTIRQFIGVNILLPSLFGMIWFIVFGGSAIYFQNTGLNISQAMAESGLEMATFSYLTNFPLPLITSALFIFTIYISYVTLADSMTSTISSLTTRSNGGEPPGRIKIYWGIMMATITIVALVAPQGEISGVDAVKEIVTVAGFPILFLMLLAAVSIVKMVVQHETNDIATYPHLGKKEQSSKEVENHEIADKIKTQGM